MEKVLTQGDVTTELLADGIFVSHLKIKEDCIGYLHSLYDYSFIDPIRPSKLSM